jgi:hypothetical protein
MKRFTIRICETMSGKITESWDCIDCGRDTAPHAPDGPELRAIYDRIGPYADYEVTVDSRAELYTVKDHVWRASKANGGCLCIGCLEQRLGRELTPEDFDPDDILNRMPGTPRLLKRRGQRP